MSKIDTTLVAEAELDLSAPPQPAKAETSPDRLILMITLCGIVLWGLFVVAFGIPGLYIPALIAVPVIWTMLLIISRG